MSTAPLTLGFTAFNFEIALDNFFLTFSLSACLILAGGFMDIIGALRQEESKLQRQLTAVQGAIAALNGSTKTVASRHQVSSPNGVRGKRTMSAAVRARISRSAKARWARIKAQKAKKAK